MSKTVLVAGKFDLLHPGHLHFFEHAKEHGSRLVVIIARDSTILRNTGQKPVFTEAERKEFVESLSIVDEAKLGSEEHEFVSILAVKPDVICVGYDQTISKEKIEAFCKQENISCQVVVLTSLRHEQFKSSKLKKRIKQYTSQKPQAVGVQNKSLEAVNTIVGDYDELEDWRMDPKGYFLIRLNRETKHLELAHCKELGIIDVVITGAKPQDVYFEVAKLGLVSRLEHASYLGKELEKAFICLKTGTEYIQDSELNLS